MGTGWCLEARCGSARKGSRNAIVIAPACSSDTSGGARPRLSPWFRFTCATARTELPESPRTRCTCGIHSETVFASRAWFFAQRVMPFDVPDELRESPSGHRVFECFPYPKNRTLTHAGFHRPFAQCRCGDRCKCHIGNVRNSGRTCFIPPIAIRRDTGMQSSASTTADTDGNPRSGEKQP